MIRLPIDIRNYKYISFGKKFVTGRYCRIECYKMNDSLPKISIGNHVQINDRCHITCVNEIEIGDNTLIASNVFITDHDHGNLKNPIDTTVKWNSQPLFSEKVRIGKNVWIGENCVILKGVVIGDNCVIGAGSIVTKDISENSVCVGNPARVIKRF